MNKNNLFDLSGRTALVTGAGQGIGLAIAEGLAGAGANIVIAEFDPERMARAAARIRDTFIVEVHEVVTDVTKAANLDALLAAIDKRCESLDILVNNAGIAIGGAPQRHPMEDWDRTMNINLRAVFELCQKAYPALKRSGKGKVINIGSMYSIFGAPYLPAYASSKGGVVQLTKSLAAAWAKNHIQVNAILPGWINSPLGSEGQKANPGIHEAIVHRTPAGRWGEAEELAGTAVYLASSASDYVTGVSIPVDGGYSIS